MIFGNRVECQSPELESAGFGKGVRDGMEYSWTSDGDGEPTH